jgi:16S rRNA processing protein RimM
MASRRTVVVGRVGRAHGIRGELSVVPRTDEPDRRFSAGAVLRTEQSGRPTSDAPPATLTVATTRWHQGRLLVTFEGIGDRTAAERLRGLVLAADVPADETPEDPDEFYDHQLIGLRVLSTDGAEVGELVEVQHGGGQDLLVVRTRDRGDVLVPFVTALVPEVDLAAGRVLVADRPGLLDPDAAAVDRPGEE